jgi:hypothetical protein
MLLSFYIGGKFLCFYKAVCLLLLSIATNLLLGSE